MAAFDFPSSPTDGQQYTANGVTWTWSAAVGAWGGGPAAMPIASAAEYRAGTVAKLLDNANVWAAADFVTLGYAASLTPDMQSGINFACTLTGNLTLNNPASNPPNGRSGAISLLGASAFTLTWGSNWRFPGGIKPSVLTASVPTIVYYLHGGGGVYYCNAGEAYA